MGYLIAAMVLTGFIFSGLWDDIQQTFYPTASAARPPASAKLEL